jgi:hypothetical protein
MYHASIGHGALSVGCSIRAVDSGDGAMIMRDGRKLVFLFGSARSGTSFVSKLLDASPDVLYRHEPDISLSTIEFPFLPARSEYAGMISAAARYAASLASLKTSRTVGSPPYFDKRFRTGLGNRLWRLNAYLAKGAERLQMRVPISDWLRPDAQMTTVMKSVSSVVRAPLFHAAMPEARIIHLVRHPCAVISSRKRGIAGGHLDVPIYVEEALRMEEAANYPLSAEQVRLLGHAGQVAYVWMLQNDKVYAELNDDPRYQFISYEGLCLDPATKGREMYAFADLAWGVQTERFLSMIESESAAKGGYFSLSRNLRSGLYKWLTDLTPQEIEEAEWVVSHSVLGRRILEEAQAAVEAAHTFMCSLALPDTVDR